MYHPLKPKLNSNQKCRPYLNQPFIYSIYMYMQCILVLLDYITKIVLVAIYFGTLPKNPMFRFSLNLLNIPYGGGWRGYFFLGEFTKFVSYNELNIVKDVSDIFFFTLSLILWTYCLKLKVITVRRY